MQSEYQGRYRLQTKSDLYPYIQVNDIDFPDSLSRASQWQTNCPPGMYRTEYCHIGSGLPIRSVIDIDKEIKQPNSHRVCNNINDTCEIKTNMEL